MTLPERINVNGNISVCVASGTSGTGLPPTVVNGIGTDGGTLWSCCVTGDDPSVNWATATAYVAGQYVRTSTNQFYLCVTGGTSGVSEPTSTDSAVTDGTITWQYINATAWASNAEYSYGDYVANAIDIPNAGQSFTFLYLNVAINQAESISGTNAPCWYWEGGFWDSVDGAVVWQWQQSEYAIQTDNDPCLFDKDLMVEGMRWAWFRAKKQDYQQERSDWDQQVKSSFARFDGPIRVNMADEMGDFDNWPNVPTGSWNVDG